MSDQAAPEPTMEEILASIRRIISEDDPPVGEDPAPAEDVLELTRKVEAPAEGAGDIDAYARSGPSAPEPAPAPAPEPPLREADEDSLVGLSASFAVASAFGQLTAAVAMPPAGRTLEDLVRELLRPLLKEWLDQNLPRIVEGKVAEEVERIARRVR